MTRPIYEIATEIRETWRPVWFGAVPYLRAMHDLETINDRYGEESGRTIVSYFLSNAKTWRGEDARRIKAEVKEMVK